MVGFAIRSRKILIGSDNVFAGHKAKVILIDRSLADNTRSKLLSYATQRNVALLETDFDSELVGVNQGCKVLGITDRNMANEILSHVTQTYRILFGGKHLG